MPLMRFLSVTLLTILISTSAIASQCASIESWTGCYLSDNAVGCNTKVEKIDFTDFSGKKMTHWINEVDMRDDKVLTEHVTYMMQNFASVNAYLDSHCSDGPCLTGHEHLCQEYRPLETE